MAAYSKKNLKQDVEDGAKQFGVAGQEMHHANSTLGTEKLGLSYQKFAPHHRIGFGHNHNQQEEVYMVIRGGGRMRLDDEIVELETLDAVRVSPAVMRGIEAGPGGIEFIVVGAPLASGGTPMSDVTMSKEWWVD